MSEAEPSEAELRQEVAVLRARIAELEGAEAERRRAQAAFEASQAAFAAVFQNAPVMMWLLDRDRRVLEMNRAAEEVAARSAQETKGLGFGNVVQCVHALDDPDGCGFGTYCATCPVRRVVSDTFATGQSHYQVEAKFTLGNTRGQLDRYFLISTSLPEVAKDHRVLVCIQDVTARMRAEEALRSAHELLERMFATTHVCIAYMDADLRFVRVNRAYAEADDHTPEFFVGKKHFDLYPNEENEAIFRRVVTTGEPCSFQGKPFEYAEHPERGVTYWDWSLHPVKGSDDKVDGVLLCLVNVTKREQAEKLARERQAMLAHVSRVSTIGEMASGLAHELGQPLGAICTYADACKNMVASGDSAGLVEAVDKIAAQAQRAAQVIRRIRGFVSKNELDRATVDVNRLIQETVALTEVEAKREGITISLELSERVPAIQADSIQIQQVIVNLVRNGFDAIRQAAGGPRTLTIQSSVDRDGAAVIAVCDTGIGPPDDASERMFEPFFSTKPDGMGLGLSISRSIVEAHGGRLWATPNPDQGMTFRFSVPADGGAGDARA